MENETITLNDEKVIMRRYKIRSVGNQNASIEITIPKGFRTRGKKNRNDSTRSTNPTSRRLALQRLQRTTPFIRKKRVTT